MKYIVIMTVVVVALAAGTQISNATSNITIASQPEKSFSINNYASEWLIPDSASRMMDYHHSLNQ